MSKKVVGIFVGSLRKGSYNQSVAEYAAEHLPEGFEGRILPVGDLALYNPDLDDNGNPPESWKKFREEVKKVDGFLFVTPEYNRSVPAALKNALDVGSRPYGASVWDGKPGAVISAAPGNLSAFGANHHLRQSMVFLNVPMMQQPEGYLAHIENSIDENGKIADQRTQEFINNFLGAFGNWVNLISGK